MKLDEGLQRQLADLAADEGLELVATEIVGSGPKMVLRLVVDCAEGVSLDQCSAVSQQASAILDVEDPIRHAYTLEVTSPGLDRKLYSEGDYERFAGRRVRVRMRPSYRAHRLVVGELLGIGDSSVQVRGDDGQVLALPLGEVFETRLEVDWDAIMKKEGKSGR